jgi:acyl carrier protein
MPLHIAAARGDKAQMDALLASGASPNAQDRYGHTPLHAAARRVDEDPVRRLLRYGADHRIRDHVGRTPLHLAARAHSRLVVRLLLEAGASCRVRDAYGKCPLHYCCGHAATWEMFQEYGAKACPEIQPERIGTEKRYEPKWVNCMARETCEAGVQDTECWEDLCNDGVVLCRLIYRIIADSAWINEEMIELDDRLVEDLQFDLRGHFSLICALVDEFSLDLPDPALDRLHTVADVFELVREYLRPVLSADQKQPSP